jgi:hypothetical protein
VCCNPISFTFTKHVLDLKYFYGKLTLSSTLSSNPKSSRSADPQFSHKMLFYLQKFHDKNFSLFNDTDRWRYTIMSLKRTNFYLTSFPFNKRPVLVKSFYYYYYFYYSKFSILIGWQAVRKKPISGTVVRIFRIWTGVPDVVYLAGNFCFANRKKFCFLISQLCVIKISKKNFKQPNCFWLCMHVYRILLPSETDDCRFNSREKHMLTDSVQPYNKPPIIDLACSVCTVKYQTSIFCMDLAPSSPVHTKKPRSDISQYRPRARSINRYYY